MATTRCKHRHTFLEHPECYERKNEKIGFLDLEASNLHADFGILLSYCIKELDGEILGEVISPRELRSPKLDERIVKKCIEDMRRFDRIITYYGTGFDIPFIRTRSLLYGLDFPIYKEIKHTDVFYWAKTKLCLHRKRLQVVCDFLGIPAKEHPMTPNQWTTALTGNKDSLDYIFTHNKEDVVSLEEVYKRLLSYTANRANSI
jgi:uncharacterized protein YprB with RNaseH-like and TPR domain